MPSLTDGSTLPFLNPVVAESVWASPPFGDVAQWTNCQQLVGRVALVKRGRVPFAFLGQRASHCRALALVVVETRDDRCRNFDNACVQGAIAGDAMGGKEGGPDAWR